MKPRGYQVELAKLVYSTLAEKMLVYLSMEERTGKSLIAILAAELTGSNVSSVHIITMKKAISGWVDTLSSYNTKKVYMVTNYHQAKKLGKCDLLILDEAHNYISSYPKRSKLWRDVKRVADGVPIIYLSATPHAQSISLLYNQFAISSWSPWREHNNFYSWFREYGIPESIWIGQKQINQYNNVKEDLVKKDTQGIFITKTRVQLGFSYEPVDKVHYVELTDVVKDAYKTIHKHKVYTFKCGTLIADSAAKVNHSLYCLEGGTTIINGTSFVLANTEKIDYILKTWGDTGDMVIMYNYRGELTKLKQYFKNAQILQATSFAEGVELSHIRHLIIYSQDYRVSKHTQRRARQASMNRKEPIVINFILVKKSVSEHVYDTVVVKKTNFVDSMYSYEE